MPVIRFDLRYLPNANSIMRRKSLKPFGLRPENSWESLSIHSSFAHCMHKNSLSLADGIIYALQLHTHKHTHLQLSPQVALLHLAALAWQAVRTKVFYDDNVVNYVACCCCCVCHWQRHISCVRVQTFASDCNRLSARGREHRKLTKYAQVELLLLLCILFAVNGKYTMPVPLSPAAYCHAPYSIWCVCDH